MKLKTRFVCQHEERILQYYINKIERASKSGQDGIKLYVRKQQFILFYFLFQLYKIIIKSHLQK